MNAVFAGAERRRARPPAMRVWLSLAAAFAIDLLPAPVTIDMARPDLTLLVAFYWASRPRSSGSIGTAWLVGLLKDVSQLSLLGLHALAYCLSAGAGYGVHRRFEGLPMLAQMVVVGAVLAAGTGLRMAIGSGLDVGWDNAESWLSPLTGALAWPLVRLALDQWLLRRPIQRSDG